MSLTEHRFYSSQDGCDLIPRFADWYSYIFVQEACACFIIVENFVPFCPLRAPVFNPFLNVHHFRETMCITKFEYFDIFNHGLGPNCEGVMILEDQEENTGESSEDDQIEEEEEVM